MAKRKTTELTTITAASLAAGDWFPVVDVSDTTDSPTGTNKKIAKSELAEAAGVTAHLADTSDAHDASAISFSATGNLSSTDVQAAIAEVDSDLTAHTGDTSDAHDASAISVLDTAGNYTATDVEGVLAELPSRFRPLANLEVKPIKVMASPPTIGTKGTSTAISSPQYRYTVYGPICSLDTSWFSTPVSGAWSVAGASSPDFYYISSVKATTGRGSLYDRFEFFVDCTTFEIMHKGVSGHWRMWVDDELVSETVTSVPNNGSVYFQPITFGSKAVRKITLDFYNARFGGIVIGPTDSVWEANSLRPRCLVIGDSITEGSNAGTCVGWVMAMAASLGWDVVNGGQGGSGYGFAGNYTGKFAQRIPYFASDDFDAVIFAGGLNDSATGLQAEAEACFALAKTTWPNAKIIATSPPWRSGVNGWGVGTASVLHLKTLIQAAATAQGVLYVDALEMPFDESTASSGTLASSASLGATSVSSSVRIPHGGVVEIGNSSSTAERRVVTNTSGVGPYTLTVAALSAAHSSGETVRHVGASFFTGTGKVGATVGDGNCDLYIDTDGTHWTAAGHKAYGVAIAHLIARALRVLASAAA